MIHTDGIQTIANAEQRDLRDSTGELHEARKRRIEGSCAQYPEGSLPERGFVLPNGAIVLEARHGRGVAIVLATTRKEYITWTLRYSDRATFNGHYSLELSEALEDYNERL